MFWDQGNLINLVAANVSSRHIIPLYSICADVRACCPNLFRQGASLRVCLKTAERIYLLPLFHEMDEEANTEF